METTHFYLIRHARTLWNLEGRVMGRENLPLAPEGIRQARRWALGFQSAALPWERILTSPLMRCVETVTLLNKPFSLPVEMDVRLQEQDWGIWTGKTHPEIQRLDAQLPGSEAAKGWEFQPPQGEIRRGVLERALEALASAAARWPGQHILVVSHEGVIRCLVYHLTGRKFLMSEQKLLKPYRMHHIGLGSKGFHVLSLNAVSLEPLECRGSGA